MAGFCTELCKKLPESLLTYILFCVFGIGSWIAVNGIWAEISILVLTVPECFTLPAILVITIQCANIGPLTYTIIKYIFQKFKPSKEYYLEVGTVFLLVIVGTAACILLVIFWNDTALVFGSLQSVALIALTFFVALVDCTSSVVFIPFMKHFPAEYISALYVGEGSSGVLASIVALSQGFVNNSIGCTGNYTGIDYLGIHFSPNVYFIFLAAMMILCGLAFLCINILPAVRKQMIPHTQYKLNSSSTSHTTTSTESNSVRTTSPETQTVFADSDDNRDDIFESSVHSTSESEDLTPQADSPIMISRSKRQGRQGRRGRVQNKRTSSVTSSRVDSSLKQKRFSIKDSKKNKVIARTASLVLPPSNKRQKQCLTVFTVLWENLTIYICLGLVNFLTNGALPAISPYVFINYGNEIYHIAINLALFVNPVICLFYVFVTFKSPVITAVLTAIAHLLAIYLLVAAILSPHPLLQTNVIGKILIVVVNVCIAGLASYIKVGVVAQLHSSENRGTALLLAGIVTQIGSSIGAVIFFFVTKKFKQ